MKKLIATAVAMAVLAGSGMVMFTPSDALASSSKCKAITDKAEKKACKAEEKKAKAEAKKEKSEKAAAPAKTAK